MRKKKKERKRIMRMMVRLWTGRMWTKRKQRRI
jgi:hypothetical protein